MGQRFVALPVVVASQLLKINEEQERVAQRIRDISNTARALLGVPEGAQLIVGEGDVVGFLVEEAEEAPSLPVVEHGVSEGDTDGDDALVSPLVGAE